VYEASLHYQAEEVPLVVLAGKDYGMGSSRDWAAKGTFLLGIKAVIAESYERIHRSNLVMMGVLPLMFPDGHDADSLGLDGTETYSIEVGDELVPRQSVKVLATRDGTTTEFMAIARCDTPIEVDYLRHGGILHMVLRTMAAS
jgi:aconitate hydratase